MKAGQCYYTCWRLVTKRGKYFISQFHHFEAQLRLFFHRIFFAVRGLEQFEENRKNVGNVLQLFKKLSVICYRLKCMLEGRQEMGGNGGKEKQIAL